MIQLRSIRRLALCGLALLTLGMLAQPWCQAQILRRDRCLLSRIHARRAISCPPRRFCRSTATAASTFCCPGNSGLDPVCCQPMAQAYPSPLAPAPSAIQAAPRAMQAPQDCTTSQCTATYEANEWHIESNCGSGCRCLVPHSGDELESTFPCSLNSTAPTADAFHLDFQGKRLRICMTTSPTADEVRTYYFSSSTTDPHLVITYDFDADPDGPLSEPMSLGSTPLTLYSHQHSIATSYTVANGDTFRFGRWMIRVVQ